MKYIYQKAKEMNIPLEVELHENSRAHKMEFSLRDPDNYFITVTEYHEY